MKYKVGDRVRINDKSTRYYNHLGTVVDARFAEQYKVELDSINGDVQMTYWYAEEVLVPELETFRDRLKHEHPECVDDTNYTGGCKSCPSDYGYENMPNQCDGVSDEACSKCWDRVIHTYIDTDSIGTADSIGTGLYGYYKAYTPDDITDCKRGTCKCGATVNSSYNFCPNCGIKFEWGE